MNTVKPENPKNRRARQEFAALRNLTEMRRGRGLLPVAWREQPTVECASLHYAFGFIDWLCSIWTKSSAAGQIGLILYIVFDQNTIAHVQF